MLFEIISGRSAFEGRTPYELILRQQEETPPRLTTVVAEVSPALADVVEALLRRDPADRPGIADLGATLLPALGARALREGAPRLPPATLVGRS